jgi:hypothetical protein
MGSWNENWERVQRLSREYKIYPWHCKMIDYFLKRECYTINKCSQRLLKQKMYEKNRFLFYYFYSENTGNSVLFIISVRESSFILCLIFCIHFDLNLTCCI